MKFQRRILPPHSPIYLEMEEYTAPVSSRQSISFSGSTSDLSEIGSIYSLPVMPKQRSDSLTNLFNMSEDSTSLSNLSIGSYSLSQHSCENGSYTNSTNYTAVSPITLSSQPPQPQPPPLLPLQQQQQQQQSISNNYGSDKISRKQYSSSYRSLSEEQNSPVNNRRFNLNNNNNNNSHRSGDSIRHYHFSSTNMIGNSLATSSQKSFSIKTAETVLNTIGITTSSSHDDLTDKCGLIAHDGNDTENNDEDTTATTTNNNNQNQHQYDEIQNYGDTHFIDNSDENELDMTLSRNTQTTIQTGRGLRKTVLSNVDRLLNSGNKQIKL